MKDIPMFTTEFGVASLFLQEVTYRERAHIKLQATQQPQELLQQCIDFCRACGATWCDASGHEALERYPRLATLVRMKADRQAIGQSTARLIAMEEETEPLWREIYNEKMKDVPNCAFLDQRAGREMLKKGGCYFVYRGTEMIGIGAVSNGCIETVAASVPGAGETVVRALASAAEGEQIELTVALENERAVRLYQRMGFRQERELSRWYRVL